MHLTAPLFSGDFVCHAPIMRGVVLQAPLCGTISPMLVAEQIPSFMAFGVCIRNCTSAVPVDFYLIFFCYGYLPYNATNSKRVTFLHLLYVYLCTAAGWGEGRGGYYWGMYETSLCCVIGVCVCVCVLRDKEVAMSLE